MWDVAFSIPIPNLTGLFCGWWLGAASIVIAASVKLRLDRVKENEARINACCICPLCGQLHDPKLIYGGEGEGMDIDGEEVRDESGIF